MSRSIQYLDSNVYTPAIRPIQYLDSNVYTPAIRPIISLLIRSTCIILTQEYQGNGL